MRVVVDDLEVLEPVLVDRSGLPVDAKLRKRSRVARQLQLHLLDVVVVDVNVAAVPGERSHLQPDLLRNHVR